MMFNLFENFSNRPTELHLSSCFQSHFLAWNNLQKIESFREAVASASEPEPLTDVDAVERAIIFGIFIQWLLLPLSKTVAGVVSGIIRPAPLRSTHESDTSSRLLSSPVLWDPPTPKEADLACAK